MSAPCVRVAIVGGGLSGLLAAQQLQAKGEHSWALFEARPSLGGRILSAPVDGAGSAASEALNRFDLGPTWFWPELQPELDEVVAGLGLARFAQFEAGDTLLERSPHEPVHRLGGYANAPAAMRLVGGMATFIDALASRLPAERLHTGHAVRELRRSGAHTELLVQDGAGLTTTWQAEHVLLALPPRLAAHSLAFSPPLPAPLQAQWLATPTWMAPHAKYLAVFDEPFWREQGLSGQARSARGPMVEIHDASLPGGSAALFGFVGVPAHVRQGVSAEALQAHCQAQLVRLFGEAAAHPKATFLKDWAADPLTATPADLNATGQHAAAPATRAAEGPWAGCLTGIASEWSPRFPGYVAGAVEAAGLGVSGLLFAEG